MPTILFLTHTGETTTASNNDNHLRLPRAFRAAGWSVSHAPAEHLHLIGDELQCNAGPLADYDRIWQLGFGSRENFLDRMQLLSTIDAERFVTAPQALMLLHGKYRWHEHMPETHISNDPARLLALTGSRRQLDTETTRRLLRAGDHAAARPRA